jgi:hypothetical protein
MTKINVTNFRAIKSASIDISGIALVAADNEGGKTSFIQACVSVLTGKTMPIDGIPAKKAALLVHSGSAGAEIVCTNDAGESKIVFPIMEKSCSGKPVEISDFAAGIKSILDCPLKDRSKIVSDLLKTNPTDEELKRSLVVVGVINDEVIKCILQTVAAQGWDAAHANAKETGIKHKALWEDTTGENFGKSKAQEWLPKEWAPDLQKSNHDALADVLKQEQEWLEVAISDEAVDVSEMATLQSAANKFSEMSAAVTKLELELNSSISARESLQKSIRELPLPKQPDTKPCPYCKGLLSVVNGKIELPTILTEKELQDRTDDIAEHEALFKERSDEIVKITAKLSSARADKMIASNADKKLKDKKPEKKSSKGTVDDCRARVASAQARLAAFDKKMAASKYCDLIEKNQAIIDVLAPDGLRLTTLKTKLKSFNEVLTQLSDASDWATVELKEDMNVAYRGTPYMLISGAAQFKARVILQLAAARFDGSQLVLIDSADILASGRNRNGLFKMLSAAQIPAVVAMAFGELKKVPVLKNGHSYWIADGVAQELK